jgi:hypothetical protein
MAVFSVGGVVARNLIFKKRLRCMSTWVQNNNHNTKRDAMDGVLRCAPAVVLVRSFLDQNVGAVSIHLLL